MTTTFDHQRLEINAGDSRRRQIRALQVIFGGAAALAILALFSAAGPGDTGNAVAPGSVRVVADQPDPGWNSDPGWDFQSS
jgi:hypothetical protein